MKLNELAELTDAELNKRKSNAGIVSLKSQFQIAITHCEQSIVETNDHIDTILRDFALQKKANGEKTAKSPNVVISEILNAEEEKERLTKRMELLKRKMDELF